VKEAESVETALSGDTHRPATSERNRYLVVFDQDSSILFPLPATGELVVGRGDDVGLKLGDTKVSRRHARFVLTEERVVVVDLESQNGTRVGGETLDGSRSLVSGDTIEIGRASLVYHEAPRRPAGHAQDLDSFRRHVALELERARDSELPFALLSIATPSDALDRLLAEREDGERVVRDGARALLARAGSDPATRAEALFSSLERSESPVRIGIAVHPHDGCDADTLIGSARAASERVAHGVSSAAEAFRTVQAGEHEIIVADAAMLRLYELLQRLAATDIPVLIQGETGSGKELAAQALHYLSPRQSRRLVPVNCAALTESLAESELFGHERGAFTGANAQKIGLLEAASGSTVFFDEIGELPLPLQAKLLRALDTQRIVRVGDVKERVIDVRVVAATNRNLSAEVAAGRFREDLLYRLGGATVWVPPLRDRPRELALLARRFLDRARQRMQGPPARLSDDAFRRLVAHHWPGNVRELKNVMEFTAAAFDTRLFEAWHFEDRLRQLAPLEAASPLPKEALRSLEEEVRELERTRISEALRLAGGNQRRAAQLIQMPLRSFVRKLGQYGLRDPRDDD
jgi:DNA-binding NtrC family response regulator